MRINLFLTSVLMLVSTSLFAQFTQVNGKLSRNSENGWKSFYVQYNSIGAKRFLKDDDQFYFDNWMDRCRKGFIEECLKSNLDGITMGYNYARKVNPIFLEYWGAIQYGWYSNFGRYPDTAWSVKVKLSIISIKVPISALYHIQLPNSDMGLEPNAGFDFRFNVYGKIKGAEIANVEDEYSVNLFDSDNCNDEPLKRFQIGWHIGLNAVYKSVFLGVSYGSDLSKIYDGYAGVKLNMTSITAGIRF